ncbi:alpha/beta fold hydrolase [Arthrobacter sp. H14]|uniref:alpha/beta fold hydrolase n=1 Tax=Arthrobacter sp. H14 TaxID=1312959 RepID=UPI00047A54EC|nr:alpha/beta hydrolase [Arthrobacter sp. H14]
MTGLSKTVVDVDGYTLDVHSTLARGSGPVYVLVHGIGASHRYFLPLARNLAANGSRVYVLDMPGFGSTPAPREALTITDFARLVLAALERVAAGPAIIVGHSMGGQVVVEMALQQPDAVTGLLLLGPTAEAGARTVRQQAWRLLRNGVAGTIRSQMVVTFDYLRCGPRWFRASLPAMLNYQIEQRIACVTVPVLIAAGERDPVAPGPWLEKLARSCPGARTAVVAGQPHAAMYTDPGAVSRLCQQTAARISNRPTEPTH